MKFLPTDIPGVSLVETDVFPDRRGVFVKVFHERSFVEHGANLRFRESYFSISKQGVIRGMHFQVPPADHAKLIYVTAGAILDVVLDIRRGSPTFGRFITTELSAKNHRLILVPAGCAHGFLAKEDDSSVTYLQTSAHSPEHDRGIRFDSFGFSWGVPEPILSDRDRSFPAFEQFDTPFVYTA